MKLTRLDHLVITAKDLQASLRFYRDILGMEVETSELISSELFISVRFGSSKINIHGEKNLSSLVAKRADYGTQDFCIIAEGDIHELKTELEEKGVEIEEGPVLRDGAAGIMDSIYIRDPDQNLVEIAVYR